MDLRDDLLSLFCPEKTIRTPVSGISPPSDEPLFFEPADGHGQWLPCQGKEPGKGFPYHPIPSGQEHQYRGLPCRNAPWFQACIKENEVVPVIKGEQFPHLKILVQRVSIPLPSAQVSCKVVYATVVVSPKKKREVPRFHDERTGQYLFRKRRGLKKRNDDDGPDPFPG